MTMTTPTVDYKKVLSDAGMPVTQAALQAEFNTIVKAEGLITNTSKMSPFWRLIGAIVTTPVMWLIDAMINVVLSNLFLATAGGQFLDLFAWAVNLARKSAVTASGVVHFYKTNASAAVTVPAGTVIQTERIVGVVYRLLTIADYTIAPGIAFAAIPVVAEQAGGAYNLAPGYFRILPSAVSGIAYVQTEENWLLTPGADIEPDDELRARVKNQYNVVGSFHTDAVYRSMISAVAGISPDRIYFKHDAPRGPGTANAYLLLNTGEASEPFIEAVNDYITTQGHHGHGDDLLCLPMPEAQTDLIASVCLFSALELSDERKSELLAEIESFIRCAFRESGYFDGVTQVKPYSRFALSRLADELHSQFSELESIQFDRGDIISDLTVPRLRTLVVTHV